MRRLILAACVALWAAAAPAAADTFVSAYAPLIGERAELQVEKCRSDERGQGLERNCARLVYLEEVLRPARTGARRISYTLQSMTLPDGQRLDPNALGQIGVGMTIIFEVDEGGSPVRVENRAAVITSIFETIERLEGEALDAESLRTVRGMFERMDEASFAQVMSQDIMPLTIFQGIDATVGEPVVGQLEMPFPLDPNHTVIANAQLLVTSVDRGAGGVARATYTQVLDEASVTRAVAAFVAQIPATRGQSLAGMRLNRRDEAQAVIDVASGRTMEVVHTVTKEVSLGAERQLRIERVTVRRRML